MNCFENLDLNCIPRRPGIYLVGGTVRDCLLGYNPKDFDIACFDSPGELAREIAASAGGRPVRIGRGDKIIHRVVTRKHTYDISAATGTNICEDLERRDFTVNAIALSIAENSIVDPLGGRRDLERKIIRRVSPAIFEDDPLRLIRAFRIAAGLEFKIDAETLAAISKESHKIAATAGERVREEWLKLLELPFSFSHVEKMETAGLLCTLFPEILPLKNCNQNRFHSFDVFTHTLEAYRLIERMLTENLPTLSEDRCNNELLASLRSASPASALIKHAMLLHDIGKPAAKTTGPAGGIHFYGHGKKGADLAGEIGRRLRMSNQEQAYVDFLIRNHLRPLSLYISTEKHCPGPVPLTRFFRKTKPFTTDLIVFSTADMMGKTRDGSINDYLRFAENLIYYHQEVFRPESSTPPLITGHDLIERFGLRPGPLFSEILDRVETGRLAGSIRSRPEAFITAKKIIDSQNHS